MRFSRRKRVGAYAPLRSEKRKKAKIVCCWRELR